MWENLAIQIPIVAAFIWFVLEMDKRNAVYAKHRDDQWREFLAAQNKAYAEALEKVATATMQVAEKLESHDEAMRLAIVRMETAAKLRQELLMDNSKAKARSNRAPRNL